MNIRLMSVMLSASLGVPLLSAGISRAQSLPAAYAVPVHALRQASLPPTPFYQTELPALDRSTGARQVTVVVDTPGRAALLKQYASQVSTPGSPLYHHFLSAQALARRFGPTPAAADQVRQALQEAGWRVLGHTALTVTAEVPAAGARAEIPVAPALYAVDGLAAVHVTVPQASLSSPLRRLPRDDAAVRPALTASSAYLAPYGLAHPPALAQRVTSANGDIFTAMSFNPAVTSALPAGLPFNIVLSAQTAAGQPLAIQSVSNIGDTQNNIGSYGSGQAFPASSNTLWQLELAAFGASSQPDTLTAAVTLTDGTTETVSFTLPDFTGSATALFPLDGAQLSQLLGAQKLYQDALSSPPGPVAILTVGATPSLSDLSALMTQESLPTPEVAFPDTGASPTGAAPSSSVPAGLESNLDLQAVASSAPGAPIADYVYSSSDPADPLTAFLALLAQKDAQKIATVSYGFYGENATALSTLMNACTAEGITVFFASGDEGAYASAAGTSLGLPAPDNNPSAVTVGGLNMAASATFDNNGNMAGLSGPAVLKAWGGDYLDGLPTPTLEAFLAENNASTGGFGSSPVPSWQAPLLPSQAAGLGTPDIASLAGLPSFQGVIGGTAADLGGTSLAAPLTAGWVDDMESADGVQHQGLGNINPLLFQTAQSHPQDFLQALWGSNGFYQVTSSTPGTWNPVTGLGAPNWDQIAQVWQQPSPAAGLHWTHAPAQATLGSSVSWTLSAVDAEGNPTTTFSGPVTLTSSDPLATLPASVDMAQGQAQFSVTFGTVGNQTLTATSVQNPQWSATSSPVSVQAPVTISTSSGPTVGHVVTVTAQGAAPGSSLRYQFWLRNPQTGLWSAPQGAYSATSQFRFTPAVPGAYQVKVYVRGLSQSPLSVSQALVVAAPAGEPMVSALSVNAPAIFQEAGQSVTFHAQATDTGGTPVYQFWVRAPHGGWAMVQNFSEKSAWTLENLQSGSYVVAVYALDSQQYQHRDFSQAFYSTSVINVGSHVTLSAPQTGTAGQPLTVSAQATGLTDPVYQFWIQSPSGTWRSSGAYGHVPYTFTPVSQGAYTATVYAKDPYAPATADYAVTATNTITVQ